MKTLINLIAITAFTTLIFIHPGYGQRMIIAGRQQDATLPQLRSSMVSCVPLFSFDTPDATETGIAAQGNFIWVGGGAGSGIYKVDGNNGGVVQILPMPPNSNSNYGGDIDFYNGYLWHVYEQSGMMHQIDPVTGAVIDSLQLPNNSINPTDPNNWGIACDDAYFWNAEYAVINLQLYFSYIHKISYSGTPLDSFLVPHWILPIKNIDHQLWGIAFETPWIYRFDKTTGAIIDSIPRCVSDGYGLTQNNMGFWLNGYSSFNSNSVHLFNSITTGIGESTPGNPVMYTLFPQPAIDNITIRTPRYEGEKIYLFIYDALGATIRSYEMNSFTGELNLSLMGFRNGIYNFRLEAGNEVCSGRFIKW